MPSITWTLRLFQELTPPDLYDMLKLRSEVFVVEQQCIFLDMDDRDQAAYHLQGILDGELIAYARILPPGLACEEPSIGRVVASPRHRGKGYGISLMENAIHETLRLYGQRSIKIAAQPYLKKIYESLGFIQCSETYMEDNIPHIKMLRKA